MISRVRWKQDEDTRPALHIHLSFCYFYSPICSPQSLSALSPPSSASSLCASAHPLPPETPPQFILPSPALSPTVLQPPPPLHPRWTEWTLCSKINFEMNDAMAVCACSMIFCQKMQWRLCLDLFTAKTDTFRDLQRLDLCSGVGKGNGSSVCLKRDFHLNAANEEAAGQTSGWNDCPITTHRGLNPFKVPLRRTQIPHLLSHVALTEIKE